MVAQLKKETVLLNILLIYMRRIAVSKYDQKLKVKVVSQIELPCMYFDKNFYV